MIKSRDSGIGIRDSLEQRESDSWDIEFALERNRRLIELIPPRRYKLFASLL